MLCWNCGESISYIGEKCPHCLSDKELSKNRYAFTVAGRIIGCGLTPFIVGAMFGIGWFVVGLICGGIAGSLIGDAIGAAKYPKP